MNTETFYNNLTLQKVKIDNVSIGLRQIGNGKNLVFIHGFPTHGYTWRKLIPELSKTFKCHILDLPGLGNSSWTNDTKFDSKSQSDHVLKLLKQLKVNKYSIIAHDSGATVARMMAITEKHQVENLILFNTEIPNHRPPWIPFYQTIGLFPTVPFFIRILLNQKWFVKSPMGFKEFYYDKSMLDNSTNVAPFLNPITTSLEKTIGAFKYLKGIDWKLIDDFKHLHKEIVARTLFIWGEQDKTFPIGLGKEMCNQFSCETKFKTIGKASLLPHEEQPEQIIEAILDFIN